MASERGTISTAGEAFAGAVDFTELRPAASLSQLVQAAGERHADGGGSIAFPGFELRWARPVSIVADETCIVVHLGTSTMNGGAASGEGARAWLSAYRDLGARCAEHCSGNYSVVILDTLAQRLFAAVDRFAIAPLCYAIEGSRLAFSDRADRVPLRDRHEIDPQAIFDYLHFHVIPAPRTLFAGVQRMRGAQTLSFEKEGLRTGTAWKPRFEEKLPVRLDALKEEFRSVVRQSVAREASNGRVGAFLSGGTDSSTVAGMLGAVTGAPAWTYSIGFDAEGYDEMEYARIAAKRFATRHREYYVTPQDLVDGIPLVASHYDQPFGNSSALPAFYCARMAAGEGIGKLLAGDGGDELFGGNTRYAKQRIFGFYDEMPALIRSTLLDPITDHLGTGDRVPVVRKLRSYVRQARLPMPQRMETYNLLERLGLESVLTPELRSAIDVTQPARHQRAVYEECDAHSLVNRMLAYDWKFTLADNDLPKVCGTARLAGVDVGFPLLSDEVVDFSLRLAPELKLKGLKLRYFFKEALRGFLPDEIITKKKHGFGLPFGVWLTRHRNLRDFAFDRLSTLRARGIVNPQFIDELTGRRLAEHAPYYGGMVWILMMLEEWLAARPELRSWRFSRSDEVPERATTGAARRLA